MSIYMDFCSTKLSCLLSAFVSLIGLDAFSLVTLRIPRPHIRVNIQFADATFRWLGYRTEYPLSLELVKYSVVYFSTAKLDSVYPRLVDRAIRQ